MQDLLYLKTEFLSSNSFVCNDNKYKKTLRYHCEAQGPSGHSQINCDIGLHWFLFQFPLSEFVFNDITTQSLLLSAFPDLGKLLSQFVKDVASGPWTHMYVPSVCLSFKPMK